VENQVRRVETSFFKKNKKAVTIGKLYPFAFHLPDNQFFKKKEVFTPTAKNTYSKSKKAVEKIGQHQFMSTRNYFFCFTLPPLK